MNSLVSFSQSSRLVLKSTWANRAKIIGVLLFLYLAGMGFYVVKQHKSLLLRYRLPNTLTETIKEARVESRMTTSTVNIKPEDTEEAHSATRSIASIKEEARERYQSLGYFFPIELYPRSIDGIHSLLSPGGYIPLCNNVPYWVVQC